MDPVAIVPRPKGAVTRRAKLTPIRSISTVERKIGRLLYPGKHPRPRKRGECEDGPRPCPYAGCRHHMAVEVSLGGSIVIFWPDRQIWDVEHTCSLDLAEDRGGMSAEEIGELMGISPARVRQIQDGALKKLRRAADRDDFE